MIAFDRDVTLFTKLFAITTFSETLQHHIKQRFRTTLTLRKLS